MKQGTQRQRGSSAIRRLIAVAMMVTIVAAVTWAATGRHVFTKYESIEELADLPLPDDPFAAAGFYDGAPASRAVRVRAFHFGLLPATRSIVDKHAVSLTTFAAPLWAVTLASAWRGRSSRRRVHGSTGPNRPFTCHRC